MTPVVGFRQVEVVAFGEVEGTPVQLTNVSRSGTNFQFSFTSQAGLSHAILYRTNLIAGSNWRTWSNVLGDGKFKTIQIPFSVFSPAQQGFVRVLTQ